MNFLEREELVKLLSHCGEKLRPLVVLALFTGMRRGEILGLKWHDIDFKRNIITLLDTKNGEKREVPMNEIVKTEIIKVRKHPDSPFIFCTKRGETFRDIRKSGNIRKSEHQKILLYGINQFWYKKFSLS